MFIIFESDVSPQYPYILFNLSILSIFLLSNKIKLLFEL